MTHLIAFQGIFQSIFAVFQSFFNVVYAFVHGVVSLVWNVLESIAEFVGASVHFVICEYKLFLSLYLRKLLPPTQFLIENGSLTVLVF